MLDEGTGALLEAINSRCEGGGFHIIDEGELRPFCPDGEGVAEALSCLADERLIELKYAEGGTYCIKPLPAGRRFAAGRLCARREAARRQWRVFLFSALGGFTGGALASLFLLLLRLLG